jgi:hypothetical protein
MLDLVYIAIVALPLTMAAAALLLISVRSIQGRAEERVLRHAAETAAAEAAPAGLRKRDDPLAPAASVATLGAGDIRALGRKAAAALEPVAPPTPAPVAPPEISEIAAALSFPPRREPAPLTVLPPLGELADGVAAAGRAVKRCPDCAEEVLVAARVCKHCRYRWEPYDEAGGRGEILSA